MNGVTKPWHQGRLTVASSEHEKWLLSFFFGIIIIIVLPKATRLLDGKTEISGNS